MKTPRDILFARHQAAAPRLDAIRRDILSAEFNNVGQASRLSPFEKIKNTETGATPVLQLLWRELIWPCRRIWTGLAAVWVLIFIANFSQRDGAQAMMTKSGPTAEMMMTFRDQQNLLNELLADRTSQTDADRSKTYLPKPRTETMELLTI